MLVILLNVQAMVDLQESPAILFFLYNKKKFFSLAAGKKPNL
jgi:hypothetical protein